MQNKSTKILLSIITICLLFVCVTVIHEIWAANKWKESLKTKRRVKEMFMDSDMEFMNKTREEVEQEMREAREEGNPYSWFN